MLRGYSLHNFIDRIEELLSETDLKDQNSLEEAACELLFMYESGYVDYHGGYPADVDWGTCKGHVFVATLDPRKEYNAPLIQSYRKVKVVKLAIETLTNSRKLAKWACIDEIDAQLRWEFFQEHIGECK